MTEDRKSELFFELFEGLPRQGPGDESSTLRALALVPGIGPDTRVLDVGCGTGLQTLVLARNSAARIVAIDIHPPFVDVLNRRAQGLGMANRLEARVGDMRRLDFADGSFELIWCEGAVYNVGFETALREWRRLLAPGGHVAVTEVCWMKPGAPPDCAAFWAQEYPDIRYVPVLLDAIGRSGYDTVGCFALPPSAWWEDYYRPLQQNLAEFGGRHRNESDAQELAGRVQREIDVWLACSEFYGYQFFVMRIR